MGLIYKITDIIDGTAYIGLTIRTLKERWNEHICRASPSANQYIDRAINKHGYENFSIEVIEDNIDESILGEREKFWIDYYDTYNNGYNLTIGGWDGGGIEKGIKIYQWDLEGNYIAEWRSARTVEIAYGWAHQDLIKCAKGKRISSHGFLWTFDLNPPKKRKNKIDKPVQQLDDYNNIIKVYDKVKDGAAAVNVPSTNISRAIRRHIKAGGYYWQYVDETIKE